MIIRVCMKAVHTFFTLIGLVCVIAYSIGLSIDGTLGPVFLALQPIGFALYSIITSLRVTFVELITSIVR